MPTDRANPTVQTAKRTIVLDDETWDKLGATATAARLGDGRGPGASALLVTLAKAATTAAVRYTPAELARMRPVVTWVS